MQAPPGRPTREHRTVRLVLAAGLSLFGAACGDAGEVVAAPTERVPPAAAASSATPRASKGVTWTHLGQQSAAALTLGPVMHTEHGPFRHSSLFVHAPGTPDPFTVVPGLLLIENSAPVRVESEFFVVELRPREPLTWGEIADDTQLVALVEGLY